jgi:hypothetical protein
MSKSANRSTLPCGTYAQGAPDAIVFVGTPDKRRRSRQGARPFEDGAGDVCAISPRRSEVLAVVLEMADVHREGAHPLRCIDQKTNVTP